MHLIEKETDDDDNSDMARASNVLCKLKKAGYIKNDQN